MDICYNNSSNSSLGNSVREVKDRDSKGHFIKGHTKVGGFTKGSRHKPESIKKISTSLVGLTERKSRRWRGDDVGYVGLHMWVARHLGKANHCEYDSSHEVTRYHWANISRKYKRELSDWMSLCPSCHLTADHRGLPL